MFSAVDILKGAATPPIRRTPVRGYRFLALAMLMGGLVGVAEAGSADASGGPVWQVHAIRYATVPAFPVRALISGADSTRTLDIAMMFWLLQGPRGRHVLVDAGFYHQKFLDSWKPADFVRPDEAVRRFGLPPDSVTDVIVTHIHWDHLGGTDLFPNARVWIQREEYEHHVGPDGVPADEAIDSVDAVMLADLRNQGRVTFVEGDRQEILPGVTAYTGGRHTFASQYLGVRTTKGTVVIASDNIYLYENLDRRLPIAQTLDAKSNLAAQRRMMRIASARRLIVPGHDPAVFSRFHLESPGVARIE